MPLLSLILGRRRAAQPEHDQLNRPATPNSDASCLMYRAVRAQVDEHATELRAEIEHATEVVARRARDLEEAQNSLTDVVRRFENVSATSVLLSERENALDAGASYVAEGVTKMEGEDNEVVEAEAEHEAGEEAERDEEEVGLGIVIRNNLSSDRASSVTSESSAGKRKRVDLPSGDAHAAMIDTPSRERMNKRRRKFHKRIPITDLDDEIDLVHIVDGGSKSGEHEDEGGSY